MSKRRALARIKQLCCLGLDSQIVVPELLKQLHEVVPMYSATFFWSDDNCQTANVYDEQPIHPK